MRQIIPFIFILTLFSCNNSKQHGETTDSSNADIAHDTVIVKIENEDDKAYKIGFYTKSYTYCWTVDQDTLDFRIGVTEYADDSTIQIRASNKNPILFSTVMQKINDCLPVIKENFNLENLSSLYFEPPILYKDLTTELSKDYKSQFGQINISHEQLNEFLMNSWFEKRIRSFLTQFDKTTRRYNIEKFHLLDKQYYNEYIPNADLNDYPEFLIHGMGISIIIMNKE